VSCRVDAARGDGGAEKNERACGPADWLSHTTTQAARVRSVDQNTVVATMPPLPLSRRPMSLLAIAFFLSHIPVTLFVDSQAGALKEKERERARARVGQVGAVCRTPYALSCCALHAVVFVSDFWLLSMK
jgi:hypothetical protein